VAVILGGLLDGAFRRHHADAQPGRRPRCTGIAVWNVEYRRYDEEGGGYPGMYHDVGTAMDRCACWRRSTSWICRASC
jgi:hypothetical protein